MVGAAPSFSEAHVIRAMLLLDGKVVGRKKLLKMLEVGEGSMRTILKRLKRQGLIKSSKQGHTLTPQGKQKLQKILEKFTRPQETKLYDLAPDKIQSLLVVKNASPKLKAGVFERDVALKAGADGAVILVKRSSQVGFPTDDLSLTEFPVTQKRVEELNLSDGDVVVISFATTKAKAEDGAISVALTLMQQ